MVAGSEACQIAASPSFVLSSQNSSSQNDQDAPRCLDAPHAAATEKGKPHGAYSVESCSTGWVCT